MPGTHLHPQTALGIQADRQFTPDGHRHITFRQHRAQAHFARSPGHPKGDVGEQHRRSPIGQQAGDLQIQGIGLDPLDVAQNHLVILALDRFDRLAVNGQVDQSGCIRHHQGRRSPRPDDPTGDARLTRRHPDHRTPVSDQHRCRPVVDGHRFGPPSGITRQRQQLLTLQHLPTLAEAGAAGIDPQIERARPGAEPVTFRTGQGRTAQVFMAMQGPTRPVAQHARHGRGLGQADRGEQQQHPTPCATQPRHPRAHHPRAEHCAISVAVLGHQRPCSRFGVNCRPVCVTQPARAIAERSAIDTWVSPADRRPPALSAARRLDPFDVLCRTRFWFIIDTSVSSVST